MAERLSDEESEAVYCPECGERCNSNWWPLLPINCRNCRASVRSAPRPNPNPPTPR